MDSLPELWSSTVTLLMDLEPEQSSIFIDTEPLAHDADDAALEVEDAMFYISDDEDDDEVMSFVGASDAYRGSPLLTCPISPVPYRATTHLPAVVGAASVCISPDAEEGARPSALSDAYFAETLLLPGPPLFGGAAEEDEEDDPASPAALQRAMGQLLERMRRTDETRQRFHLMPTGCGGAAGSGGSGLTAAQLRTRHELFAALQQAVGAAPSATAA